MLGISLIKARMNRSCKSLEVFEGANATCTAIFVNLVCICSWKNISKWCIYVLDVFKSCVVCDQKCWWVQNLSLLSLVFVHSASIRPPVATLSNQMVSLRNSGLSKFLRFAMQIRLLCCGQHLHCGPHMLFWIDDALNPSCRWSVRVTEDFRLTISHLGLLFLGKIKCSAAVGAHQFFVPEGMKKWVNRSSSSLNTDEQEN